MAIIDLLYFGEAKIFQENLESFLLVAEDLQLRGLTGKNFTDVVKEHLTNDETEIKIKDDYVKFKSHCGDETVNKIKDTKFKSNRKKYLASNVQFEEASAGEALLASSLCPLRPSGAEAVRQTHKYC